MTDMSRVQVPKTGTYAKRAALLMEALGDEIRRVFGVVCAVAGDKEKPSYSWKLPERVSLWIARYMDADPQVWISREDPVILDGPDERDWKREIKDRDYQTGAYDVAAIVEFAREFVEYNRKKREEHEANVSARARELADVGEIPDGISLTRDPKTGLYEFWMSGKVSGVEAGDVRRILDAAKAFKRACASVAKKETA